MATVVGIGCCSVSAVLHGFCERNQREAEALESAIRVKQLKDLARLLQYNLSPIVTYSGVVAVDKLLKCKRSGLEGVVVEETVRKRILKKRIVIKKADAASATQKLIKAMAVGCGLIQEDKKEEKHNIWREETDLVSSTRNEVPWYLDDWTGRLHIEGVRLALELTGTNEGYEPETSNQAFLEDAVGCLQGAKKEMLLGIEWTDRAFRYPVGQSMTVVGEVYKDNGGKFSLRRPENGPFLVAYGRTIDEIIAKHKRLAGIEKAVSMGLTVVGLGMILTDVIPVVLGRLNKENSS